MDTTDLRGLGVALITPFKTDQTIDYEALKRVLDNLLLPTPNVDYILVMGTTAETPTLSEEERVELKNFVQEYVAKRVPLILGLGGNCTNALKQKLNTEYLSGYQAILSVVPYYNKPNQNGIYSHFAEIAKASPLPVILYNIPGRTGVNMESDTVLKLASDFKNIIGIKEASGNLQQIQEILQKRPKKFAVISGDDSLTYDLMKNGADGVISVIGNAYPKVFKKMTDLLLQNDTENSNKINIKYNPLCKAIFADGNPAGIKYLLNNLGLIENVLRLPLVPVNSNVEQMIKRAAANLK